MKMDKQYDLFRASARTASRRDEAQSTRLTLILSSYTAEDLAGFHRSLTGSAQTPKPKARLVDVLAGLLDIQTPEEYAGLMEGLTPSLRDALVRGVFEDWIPVAELVSRHGVLIVESAKKYAYYEKTTRIIGASRLELFALDGTGSRLALPGWLRELLIPFVPKPEGWTIHPLARAPDRGWTVDGAVADILPLFRKALGEILETTERRELSRKGLKKADLGRLHATSGLPPFGIAAGHGLDSAELLARFLALFDLADTAGERDPEQLLKTLVGQFFKGKATSSRNAELDYHCRLADSWFEQAALLDHLSRRQGYSVSVFEGIPSARRDFRMGLELVEGLRDPGAWVDARTLFDTLCLHLVSFRVTDEESESYGFGIRAEALVLHGLESVKERYETTLSIAGPWRRDCFARPLFEGYVYLFASLGILEIAEAEPPLPLLRKKKKEPISPADCLWALRLTPLGRWCLGFSGERPLRPVASFEALADEELLLVTFRGSSLERRLFLDLVATPLGAERWRFTEARFIAGCESRRKIEARIDDFKRLIDPEPASRWLAFFEGIRTRAAILPSFEPAFVIPLPADPAIRRVFVENPKLRALAKRVEDGSIVVREADLPALTKLLVGLGFWAPEMPKKPHSRRGEGI